MKYSILGKYKNIKTPIKIKHNKCNEIYYVKPCNFIRHYKHSCPYCYLKKGNTRAFKHLLFKQYGQEYSLLSKYYTENVKVTIKHNKCNYIYKTLPINILKGHGCPHCNKRHVSTRDFCKKINNRYPNKFKILSIYVNSDTKIKVQHNLCHRTFFITPHKLLTYGKCPYCHIKRNSNAFYGKKFKNKVKILTNDTYHILTLYQGINKKIKFRDKYNHIFFLKPSNFISGTRCPICSKRYYKEKWRQKAAKHFLHRMHSQVGDKYYLCSKYINKRTKVSIRHNRCGHIYRVTPNSFLEHSRCPYCTRNHRRTTIEFKRKVYKQIGHNYQVLSRYINNNTPITFRHMKCGRIYRTLPRTFLSAKSRCPYCTKNHRRTTDEFKEYVFKLVNNKYSVLGQYINGQVPIKMKHNKCGNVYFVRPSGFLEGYRCPRCSKILLSKRFSKGDEWTQLIHKLYGEEYTILGKYRNANTKIKVRHNKCGHIWYPYPSNFPLKSSCPYCHNPSHGEQIIACYLNYYNIQYIYSYRLNTSRIKVKRLHLDFYLPKYHVGIEFDGIQHFIPVDFSGKLSKLQTINQFHRLIYRDRKKDKYCLSHNINLIRVKNRTNINVKRSLKKFIKGKLNVKLLPLIYNN